MPQDLRKGQVVLWVGVEVRICESISEEMACHAAASVLQDTPNPAGHDLPFNRVSVIVHKRVPGSVFAIRRGRCTRRYSGNSGISRRGTIPWALCPILVLSRGNRIANISVFGPPSALHEPTRASRCEQGMGAVRRKGYCFCLTQTAFSNVPLTPRKSCSPKHQELFMSKS